MIPCFSVPLKWCGVFQKRRVLATRLLGSCLTFARFPRLRTDDCLCSVFSTRAMLTCWSSGEVRNYLREHRDIGRRARQRCRQRRRCFSFKCSVLLIDSGFQVELPNLLCSCPRSSILEVGLKKSKGEDDANLASSLGWGQEKTSRVYQNYKKSLAPRGT